MASHPSPDGPAAREFALAYLWMQRGKRGRAMEGFQRALELDPAHLDAATGLAQALMDEERLDEALASLERGLLHHPNSAFLHKQLITALDRRDGPDAAYERYGLHRAHDRPIHIVPGELLCCTVLRNERQRLPFFLRYYRAQGVTRFLMVDNGSTDGTGAYLLEQPDVLLWQSDYSFNQANFGSVWFELLLRRYGRDHWCVMVDADEFLVFPNCENRSLRALCHTLTQQGKRVFPAILLEMYSDRPLEETVYHEGADPLEVCSYFDRRFFHSRHEQGGPYHNQPAYFGGVRERVFGSSGAYYLSKVPLLRYDLDCLLAGGQHWTNLSNNLIARSSGALLHFKFFATFPRYVASEVARGEHYGDAMQYREYARHFQEQRTLTLYDPEESVRYVNSQQLVELGIMNSDAKEAAPPPPASLADGIPPIHPLPPGAESPFWSVMLTLYDRLHSVERALASVLAQAPAPSEMQITVVMDGGAGEPVAQAVRDLVQRVGGERVTLHRCETRLGHPEIFNECLRQARGRWIHILHDDDCVAPGFYEALRRGIEASPSVGAAFCRHTLVSAAGERWTTYLERESAGILEGWLPRIATLCRMRFSASVVRRSAYEAVGGYTAQVGSAFDWEMWQRLAVSYPVWYEPQVLATLSHDGTSETERVRLTGQQVEDSFKVILFAQHYLPPEQAAQLAERARWRIMQLALHLADQQWEAGEPAAALTNIQAVLHHCESEKVLPAIALFLKKLQPA